MPLGKDIKYRWKTMGGGKKVRLAFKGNKVVETKVKGSMAELTDYGKKAMRNKHSKV